MHTTSNRPLLLLEFERRIYSSDVLDVLHVVIVNKTEEVFAKVVIIIVIDDNDDDDNNNRDT